MHTERDWFRKIDSSFNVLFIICPETGSLASIGCAAQLESHLPLSKAKGAFTLRILGPAVLLVLILASNSFAAPAVVKASIVPEPGLLALLGGGLVGLATLIRHHLSD